MVWLPDSGPGGGGGGGGDHSKERPRAVRMAGASLRTIPAARSRKLEPVAKPVEPSPIAQLTIPVEPLGEAVAKLVPGSMDAPPSLTTARGSGSDDGAGDGRRGGDGPGDGTGHGPGFRGNQNGGPYLPGNKVSMPRLVREVKPLYTADAMRARIQGAVWLECVVQADGTVGRVRVVRSLDPMFGLDREAIDAARRWRFLPATRLGEPVDVLVTIELQFTLR